ncbi:MAG: universal stress protein [Alphaproteobacteria bacterium]
MTNYRLILCPIDFSKPSRHAFETALDLAERLKTGLHVLNVYQLPAAAIAQITRGLAEQLRDFEAVIEDQLQKQLAEFVSNIETHGIKIVTRLREGIPYVEIVQATKDLGADLIVIGTHGRTGLAHLMLGSVAERVLRTSNIPVLSVRCG